MRFNIKYSFLLQGFLLVILLNIKATAEAQKHPLLLLNTDEVSAMQSGIQTSPVWKQMVTSLLLEADQTIIQEIAVPVPKDPAGGYTHTQHKQNAQALKQLGLAYLISGKTEYAEYAKSVFIAYADLYPDLGQHPVNLSYATGKLFWQQLNEAVWLVDAIQGYDAIYNYLSEEERIEIEGRLLRPFADFLSIENPGVFNRIHNHGVWSVAAVGMTGITLSDDELVCRALYGIDESGKANRTEYSNEDISSLSSGFLVQTLKLFSPDGYYTEGPYYQRYAMTPFLLFAQSLDKNIPELKIMKYRNGIFIKAVETLVDLSDSQGRYYPINDDIKGMSLYSPESQAALCFLYARTGNTSLLSILEKKPIVQIDANSLRVAADLSASVGRELVRTSKIIHDGSNGDEGGIALIRDKNDRFCAILKFASHGLTHGHFDRLNLIYYLGDNEILSDYGSVRYVNIEAKEGGRYLPENESYAKQSVAHNTLVINEKSHFEGNFDEAQKTHGELVYADFSQKDAQIVCARETQAYPGIEMLRISGLIQVKDLPNPLLLDLFQVKSEIKRKSFDLPFHFEGDILSTGFVCDPFTNRLSPMGDTDGYQHLWKIAEGNTAESHSNLTWLNNSTIFTLTFSTDPETRLYLTRSGANDPAFNMRSEPALIIREKNKREHVFASLLEVHGNQDESTEMVSNQVSAILSIKPQLTIPGYLAVEFETRKNSYLFLSVTESGDPEAEHILSIDGKEYHWTGYFNLYNLNR